LIAYLNNATKGKSINGTGSRKYSLIGTTYSVNEFRNF
jgi:hypothetical protein